MDSDSPPESVLDSATREEMRQYGHDAAEIAQNQFASGTRHFWMSGNDTTSDDTTLVQVFELEGDHQDEEVPNFVNAFDLIRHYETRPPDANEDTVNRRLYVVQNPSSAICEFLGIKLGVPPEVFLAHCDSFVDLSLVDDGFTQRDHSTYWKVPVPHCCMPVCREEPAKPGRHYVEAGFVDREYLQYEDDNTQPLNTEFRFFNFVLYWAKNYGEDGASWTAIILIDPHHTRLRCVHQKTGEISFTELKDFDPQRRLCTEVNLNRNKIELSHQPYARPFYEALVNAHLAQSEHKSQRAANQWENFFSPTYTADPFSVTVFARNLIRAAWEEFIIRRALDFHDTQRHDSLEHDVTRESLSTKKIVEKIVERADINVMAYYDLVERRREVERWRTQVDTVVDAFNIRQSGGGSLSSDGRMDSRAAQEGHNDTITCIEIRESRTHSIRKRNEGKAWGRLQQKLADLQTDVISHMEMFAQRAAFEQTFATNVQTLAANEQAIASAKQARSSGQLTKIATVIVPCTFVASIFSMGGDFAAGESLFGVYWAVSIPVTLALLAWILHDDILEFSRDVKSRTLSTGVGSRLRNGWRGLRGREFVARDKDNHMEEGRA